MAQTRKYLMYISYIGSTFRGSQYQVPVDSNDRAGTVQYVFEKALKHVYKLEGERPITICLASRTDKGVHALRAALNVNLPVFKSEFIQPVKLTKILNNYFFKGMINIRVVEACYVPDSFYFSKIKKIKTYMYRLGLLKEEYSGEFYDGAVPVTEVDRTYLSNCQRPFDLKKAQEATYLFQGVKDFGAIVGRPSKNTISTICNITTFQLQESEPLMLLDPLNQRFHFYQFLCKGDRFLYHMIRRMVSVTLGVGFGILNLEDVKKLFDEPLPSSWPSRINIVPGCGLYLLDISLDMKTSIDNEEVDEKKNDDVQLESSDSELSR